jgi:NAD(P)-dependent dehydrogenase (short-subunit alcohol dehydrogenase family)
MVDGGAFDGDKAYKDSKLCNVLFTRELSKRLIASGANGVTVNCFSPGLITKSGLFRNRECAVHRLLGRQTEFYSRIRGKLEPENPVVWGLKNLQRLRGSGVFSV